MLKFLASCRKELLVLLRDKAGLALLFIMPMALVLVITLIQNDILDKAEHSRIKLLLLDNDQGQLGQTIEKELEQSDSFQLKKTLLRTSLDGKSLRNAIARGDFQVGVIVEEGASQRLEKRIEQAFRGETVLSEESEELTLVFDPTLQAMLKQTVESAIQLIVSGEQFRLLLKQAESLAAKFPAQKQTVGTKELSSDAEQELVAIRKENALLNKSRLRPNAVQHNVPAWTIFGIFFSVLPLSVCLIRERHEQTLTRLYTLPVPFVIFLLAKIAVYAFISVIQLGLMLWVGISILPLFGTPVLDLGGNLHYIIIVGLSASLAATGYGMMIGTVVKSYDQAYVFGAVSILILAALGGIMVPVYMMPDFMQPLSVISPLGWGQEAFLDIFVRGVEAKELLPNILLLLAFFVVTLAVALCFSFSFKRATMSR